MSEVSKTTVSASEVITPKLIANEISCDLMTSIHAGTLSSNVAYIKDLVVDKISIAGETEGNSIGNETYEVPMFGEIKLDFSDDFNGKYLICNENDLEEGLKKAFEIKDKTVVVDVIVDPNSRVYPMQIGTGSMADMFLNKTERT